MLQHEIIHSTIVPILKPLVCIVNNMGISIKNAMLFEKQNDENNR